MIRKSQEDDHYCACIFIYTKEYAVKLRDIATFICTDDKHKIIIGEPGYPLASVPRGKRVLVGQNQLLQVADHDYSKISLIPTTILINEIPETVDGSWYRGLPHISVKITAVIPSTALRDARESVDALVSKHGSKNTVPLDYLLRWRARTPHNVFKC